MKKDNIILIKFLGIMAFATSAGVVCGRLALPLAEGQIFLPQMLFLGPVLIAVSAACLAAAHRSASARLLQQAVILGCTGFGVVLSGFCGFYTLADVPLVALSAVAFFAVVSAGVIIQHKNGMIITHTAREKPAMVILWATVFVSVFAPIGPMPVVIAGVIWVISATQKV